MPREVFSGNSVSEWGDDGEAGLLARVEEAAAHRRFSPKTLEAYRRTWVRVGALAAARDLDLAGLSREGARGLYPELAGARGPSHHLQVKAALGFLYRVLDQPNPFEGCLSPKFDIAKVELKYLTAAQVGRVLGALRGGEGYYARLSSTLAAALFLTATRFHEWAGLERERLLWGEGGGLVVRLRTKGGRFSDRKMSGAFARSLRGWLEFSEAVQGVRLRTGGLDFAASPYVFPGRDGKPFTNEAFNLRLKAACRDCGVPVITAHGLRHAAATALLNEKRLNLKEVQEMLGHQNISTTARYTHVDQSRLSGMSEDLEGLLP
jgi:integrase